MLSWKETQKIAKRYKLPAGKAVLAKTEEEAAKAAKKMFPVALKIVSVGIVHKSDIGGVITGISSEAETRKAFRQLTKCAKKRLPRAKIEGVLVQKMVSGIELVVGASIDPQFGPVVMFGAGGLFVEAMNDVSFRVAPINRQDAEEMLTETKVYEIMKGYRGKRYNINAVVDILLKASRIISKKVVKELDLNPVIVNQKAAEIVDIRLVR